VPRSPSPTNSMIEQTARAIAGADGAKFEDDPDRFQRLALAALKPGRLRQWWTPLIRPYGPMPFG
jgi:hypothetical protein